MLSIHINELILCLILWILQVESFNTERSLRKIKRHTSSDVVDVSETARKVDIELSTNHMDRLTLLSEDRVAQSNDMEVDCQISQGVSKRDTGAMSFSGGPSSWYCFSTYYTLLISELIFKQTFGRFNLLCLILPGILHFTLSTYVWHSNIRIHGLMDISLGP